MASARETTSQRDPIETRVACAALGPHDTSAAREFRLMLDERADPAGTSSPGGSLVERLAARLRIPPEERAVRVLEAVALARRALAEATGHGAACLPVDDVRYPECLRNIVDPPIVLWVTPGIDATGSGIQALTGPAVAIVGARDASAEGLLVARRLGRGLAEAGLTIVSGLARGIDGAAHLGALDGGGRTVAVLGCGVDRIYPSSHRALADRIRETGAIVSEFPPGTPPLPPHFPRRNRIISGLATAVIVIEASERSGSLITARAGLEQGREVLAVPGGVSSGRSSGCHGLIKDGAKLVETVKDVLEELTWYRPVEFQAAGPDKSRQMSDLERAMSPGAAWSLDDLLQRVRRPAPEILAELSALELAGVVERVSGGRFVRLDGPAME